MKSVDELISDLKKSDKNYTDDQINEIVSKYKNYISNKGIFNKRSDNYKEVAELLGVDSLNNVRFYKIMNISAVVVRDTVNNKTKVAFSFYNTNDLINVCKELDKQKTNCGKIIWNNNNIPMLHQITVSRAKDSCLCASKNYHDNKFCVEFNDIRISELAVYESWIKLVKSKSIPRIYRKLDLGIRIVSLSELRRREALKE